MRLSNKLYYIMLFAVIGVIYFVTDNATAAAGLILANGAAAAIDWDTLKNELSKFSLTNPETLNGLKGALKEGMEEFKNSNTDVAGKIDALIEQIKNQQQNQINLAAASLWCHSLLTETERTGTDMKELHNIGFNRYARLMYHQFKNTLSAEQVDSLRKSNDAIKKHALQSELSDAAGGYLVPIPVYKLLIDDLRESGLYWSETTQIEMTAAKLKIPVIAAAGHPTLTHVAEGAAKPVSNITFGVVELDLEKYACLIPWTDELVEDSGVDIEGIIREYYRDWAGLVFDNILFDGDADIGGINDFTVTYQETGGAAFSSVVVDDVIRAMGKLRAVDLRGAKWYMSPSVWAELQTKKGTDGQYLITQNDVNAMKLRGYPVMLTDSSPAMSASGASKPFITFGNLKKVYVGVKKGLRLDVSNVASFLDGETTRHSFQDNLTVMRIETRTDLQIPFPLRIVQIKTAAA